MYLFGIDIGGTKITATLADETGHIYETKRIETQALKGAKKGVPAIVTLVNEVLASQKVKKDQLAAMGISCPGPISAEQGMILNPPNLKGWENTPLVEILEKDFTCPVFMNNDANGAAVAEWEFGAEKQTPDLVYLTASTGMGGGIILNNRLCQGITDTVGEVGHYVLDINGPDCPCGQKGCFEVYCGGADLAKRIQTQIKKEKIKTKILDHAKGKIENIDMICLVNALKEGDSYAQSIWNEFIVRLAQGIGIIIQVLNPEAIVLGTIAIHTGDLLLTPLKKELPRFAWKQPLSECRISASELGDKIGVLGAIALAINGLKNA